MKKITITLSMLLLILSMFTSHATITSVPSYHITLMNHGAYVLGYSYMGADSKEHKGSFAVLQYRTFDVLQNAMLSLWAEAGKSTKIQITHTGTIDCKGTTFIGFSCKYV